MKWCSTYLYRSIQKRRAKDMIRLIEQEPVFVRISEQGAFYCEGDNSTQITGFESAPDEIKH